jgi:hypothetical protein
MGAFSARQRSKSMVAGKGPAKSPDIQRESRKQDLLGEYAEAGPRRRLAVHVNRSSLVGLHLDVARTGAVEESSIQRSPPSTT